ncbi:UDP-glucose 4-epimerase GalE [Sinorhizobium medicae]|uniref:UDP-glucose 4-epimerase n=2 Tax=Sinorhizobium medicae TaxID=110321 RepID=A6U5U7_SINMW|nr:UDP-glucose 4-epimerase GalE [Sinorhizobium medicae]ABR59027.1 UDP-glucose 4-epimerase [Sinorhizobium medicae WSM419]MBO1963744.1 UDP-glucose 4-epimerase GalE [Sinorhizobium medicae]MDX0406048.1 UDP-glucose 4-epimerase GalE [Sinorhizobium medicae]MDX0414363.1 UDP-glucose 4-epimerase GalE [Sinorhizobium medicae]MDX0417787.1 UDP-glucose 4-epimerase GalE [Sinorhizobium medicae]
MAVLVTGGAGYIGSHMVWSLLDAGEAVVVLDCLSTGFRWAVAPEPRFYLGDAGDRALLQRVFAENDIDSVVHFAGSAVVPESVANPLAYYENNTANTRTLVAATIEAGIRHFVFSSTAAVYGTQDTPDPVSETAAPRPQSPYGRSKWMSELMLADAAAAHDFRFVALRYFNVAGADPLGRAGQSTFGATHLIKVACEAALGKRHKVDVFGIDYPTADGTGVRDYIHVSDLVAAHRSALAYLRMGGEPLVTNCGYGHGFSVLQVLDTVRQVSGRDFTVDYAPRRPGDPAQVVADPSVARLKLDWVPTHASLEHIVQSAYDWEGYLSRKNSFDREGDERLIARG